ncbi:LysR family transcriptional regulator [Solirubrobacter sp. CPCC 204708]|uniref:LysR substrate-binding domain-containing protein n=1 Tax=Solirubrobacter deserti TaxID=2282478 RepID=A0ABT4RKK7_9ACTN|nr:LysR substrate-binding domain-containing protein [Solirubrobacter deserti]MBE2317362.1 LysR family transcriptional regulator [Solirubrobacter deserti]MDA0139091.1 LysR substrate-binding domain-containing protein [Solirubrobacter deserti]
MLDPRRLRLLIQLESLGTVRAVASAASMSPSAVSQQLAALERESGAALLERHGRTVALTDTGVALAGHARLILERIEAAEEALRALRDAPAGSVRVSAFTSAMRGFVIDAAAEVARVHPGISVQLAELEPAENVPALERGEVDLAIVADFGDGTFPHTPQLRSVPLAQDELQAVLPPGTPFSGALADLREHPWLLDGTELEGHIIRRCRQAGFEPRFAGRLFSHEALLYAVQRGLGVTVLPSFVLAPAGAVERRSLDPVARRDLLVLHREEALTRRSVALVLDVLTASAAAARSSGPSCACRS